MDSFTKAKTELIKKLGRQPLDDIQINTIASDWFGVKWGGVGSQSMSIPKTPDRYYIVNTCHSDKSPGYHWVALYISKSGKSYIYDSFARNVKKLMPILQKNIKGRGIGVNTNKAEQHIQSALCGHISLAFLKAVQDCGIRKASAI